MNKHRYSFWLIKAYFFVKKVYRVENEVTVILSTDLQTYNSYLKQSIQKNKCSTLTKFILNV